MMCRTCQREVDSREVHFMREGECVDCLRAYIEASYIAVEDGDILVLRQAGLDSVIHRRTPKAGMLEWEVAYKVQRGCTLVAPQEVRRVAAVRGITQEYRIERVRKDA